MKEYWIFTFGQSFDYGELRGKAVKIAGTYQEARNIMFERYGNHWVGQYSEKEWNDIENNPCRFWSFWSMEEIIEVIDNE